LIEDGEFDLVHSHSTKAGVLARIAAARAGVPSVFTVHGWGFYNTEYRALRPVIVRGEQLLAKQTDGVVCVSENDRIEGREHGILSPGDGTVIHNGIPPVRLPPDRPTIYDEFGIDHNRPVIGAIARLAPQKNPLAILKAAKRLRDRGLDFTTVLIGSGPLFEDCQQFVDDNDLSEVYLPGFRDDALDLLPDFDVFLLPSRFEGFPLTVLECLHAGVPIVAHDVGGVAEAIDHGTTGFVVTPDPTGERVATQVATILESPEKQQKMGNRARQVATHRFTEERMVSEYSALYQEILER